MAEKEVTIRNKNGIHCRPSGCIITEAQKYPQVRFFLTAENGGTATLTSLLELLALGLCQGDKALLKAEGPEAEIAVSVLAALFEKEFDFPPKQ